jgi:hypothetical protein
VRTLTSEKYKAKNCKLFSLCSNSRFDYSSVCFEKGRKLYALAGDEIRVRQGIKVVHTLYQLVKKAIKIGVLNKA